MRQIPVFDGIAITAMEKVNVKLGVQITRRELEVLALLAEGLTNQEIAGRLSITRTTARTHLTHIYRKLKVRRRTEAVIRFIRLCNRDQATWGFDFTEPRQKKIGLYDRWKS